MFQATIGIFPSTIFSWPRKMFTQHKELFAPTGVEHSITAEFFNSGRTDLVVAKTTVLEVYRIHRYESNSSKLELAAQYHLWGSVQSMAAVRLAGHDQDSIILTFSEAKLSIVEYDPARNDLSTVSLHEFEDESLKHGQYEANNLPEIRVDPLRKCAVALVHGEFLAVLPIRQKALVKTEEMRDTNSVAIQRSFTVQLNKIDPNIRNIRDIIFLQGYFEPTIALLYETIPSSTGRLVLRKDTSSLSVISLDLLKENHTVIWSFDGLPTDALRLQPVPRPLGAGSEQRFIGGVIVFCANNLVHLNQGSNAVVVKVNHYANISTNIHLLANKVVDLSSFEITLDASVSTFISNDRLILALRNGDLLLVQLKTDGGKISTVLMERAGTTILPTCITAIGHDLFFLGSRLGDSVLIRHQEDLGTDLARATPIKKKPRLERLDSKLSVVDELDLLLFSQDDDIDDRSKIDLGAPRIWPGITLSVCDVLINIGPIADMAIGEPAETDSELVESAPTLPLELVTCSGHGKNGAITILQSDVRASVLSSVNITNAQSVWAIHCFDPARPHLTLGSSIDEEAVQSEYHQFLIIARDSSTVILGCGEELQEVVRSDFHVGGGTVYCGSLFDGQVIVQVYAAGVRSLGPDGKLAQLLPLDHENPVVSCSGSGPYLLLHHRNGDVAVLIADDAQRSLSFANLTPQINLVSTSACYLFEDRRGTMVSVAKARTSANQSEATEGTKEKLVNLDEIDVELYGDAILDDKSQKDEFRKRKSSFVHSSDEQGTSTMTVTTWMILYRQNGTLEIFSVPDFESVYSVPNFGFVPPLLYDVLPSKDQDSTSDFVTGHKITEVFMTQLGNRDQTPRLYLMARSDDQDHAVYVAFVYVSPDAAQEHSKHDNRLALRFARVSTGYLTKDAYLKHDTSSSGAATKVSQEQALTTIYKRTFSNFTDINGCSGVFLSGPRPLWMFNSKKGGLLAHPMWIDGPINAFHEFHNVNCPRGFVYISEKNALRICLLPSTLHYDVASWPLRKVSLRRTATKIAYHTDAHCYALCTTTPTVFQTPLPTARSHMSNENEMMEEEEEEVVNVEQEEDKERAARAPTIGTPLPMTSPQVELHQLELVVPTTWEVIDSYGFQDYERVCSLRTCLLLSEQTSSGRKPYICLGTVIHRGEDFNVKGRILIFDVVNVVPDPDRPQANKRLKRRYQKEYKSPITAVAEVNGYLITCIGQKIIIHSFEDNENLVGVGFIDQQLYAGSLCTIRNYILVGDVFKSIWFLRFKDGQPIRVDLAGKDYTDLKVFSCEFLVEDSSLIFVVCDDDKNVHLYSYSPQNVESVGGHCLVHQGDFHLGHAVNRILRLAARGSKNRKHLNILGTLDGSISTVLPIPEKTFRRLQYLQSKMNTFIPHHAGLNPRAHRMYRPQQRINQQSKKNILDGDLLIRFALLGFNDQKELAQQIGSSVEQIMQDFLDVQDSVSLF